MGENIVLKKIILIFKGLFKENCHYINGPETLPPPLTKEEEMAVITRIVNGEEEQREQLIVHNLRLVVYIAKKFEGPFANVEDLISIGTIGLIKAVKTFQPERNIKVATYASRCIENEILMYLRKTNNSKTEISIDEPLSMDWDGNELLLSDILGSDGDEINRDIEMEDERQLLLRTIAMLNPREQEIMRMRFGLSGLEEMTQKQVADCMGISQSYISRLEKRIISHLRDEIEKVIK